MSLSGENFRLKFVCSMLFGNFNFYFERFCCILSFFDFWWKFFIGIEISEKIELKSYKPYLSHNTPQNQYTTIHYQHHPPSTLKTTSITQNFIKYPILKN